MRSDLQHLSLVPKIHRELQIKKKSIQPNKKRGRKYQQQLTEEETRVNIHTHKVTKILLLIVILMKIKTTSD